MLLGVRRYGWRAGHCLGCGDLGGHALARP